MCDSHCVASGGGLLSHEYLSLREIVSDGGQSVSATVGRHSRHRSVRIIATMQPYW
jgi:hypothetical protein